MPRRLLKIKPPALLNPSVRERLVLFKPVYKVQTFINHSVRFKESFLNYSKSCASKHYINFILNVYDVSLAHKYQEKSCMLQIEELKKCCERLSPLVLKFSDTCQGILSKRK